MKLCYLTYLIFQLISAIDSGKKVALSETMQHIEQGDLFDWLERELPLPERWMDLSLLDAEHRKWISAGLSEIYGGYGDRVWRKFGIENDGLCLLISWTSELVQRGEWSDADDDSTLTFPEPSNN